MPARAGYVLEETGFWAPIATAQLWVGQRSAALQHREPRHMPQRQISPEVHLGEALTDLLQKAASSNLFLPGGRVASEC